MFVPAGDQLEDKDDAGDNEDNMDQPAENIEQEADQPKGDQDQDDPPNDFAHEVTRFPSCLLIKSYPSHGTDKPARAPWRPCYNGRTGNGRGGSDMATPSMEDYLEQIWLKSAATGEARVSDIAEALEVLPSSVTKMARKLDREGYLVYERYKGLILTSKGEVFGRKLAGRHELLERFLRLIGVDEKHVYNDVEGIEHHLSWDAIDRITDLVRVLEANPATLDQLERNRAADRADEERER